MHIGRLRRRFEGWSEFEIVSVRGLGYKAVKKAVDKEVKNNLFSELEVYFKTWKG